MFVIEKEPKPASSGVISRLVKSEVPSSIWAVSFAAFLLTLSASIVFTIAPHYLRDVLGLNIMEIGLMEGIVEFFALMVRVLSGAISDMLMQRKSIILWGFGLSSLAKLGIPFASNLIILYITRIMERLGNGLQAAPRDALVGDLAPKKLRGAAYGMRQAFGKAGSSVGAFSVFVILFVGTLLWGYKATDLYYTIFWVGVVPSFIGWFIVFHYVKDKPLTESQKASPKNKIPLRLQDVKNLGGAFWKVMIVMSVFNFSHFSETFLQLRARDVGIEITYAPLVMVLMNFSISVASFPVGRLSDKFGRRFFFWLGLICVIIADLLLATATGSFAVFLAIIFWGCQMAMTQGMVAALVTDTADAKLRGTAFGVLNVLTGVVYLIASPFYGWVWEQYGGFWPFMVSAGVTVLSMVLLYMLSFQKVSSKV